jgi:hypothetical protein
MPGGGHPESKKSEKAAMRRHAWYLCEHGNQ